MHDSFTKEWMEGILTDFGEVTIEKQIAGEVRKIDLYFCPNPAAIAELTALPLDHPYRGTTLHHISRLQINLKLRQNKSKEIREIIMNLAPAYDKWLEEVEAKAIAKGGTEAQISIARRMLKMNLPMETIAQATGLSIELLQQLRSNDSSS